MRDHLAYRLLGETVDDAAGEAFDKAGRLLGLGYPGGPAIAAAAAGAAGSEERLPRAWLGDSFDFSFSGLKTALRRIVETELAAAGLPPAEDGGRLPAARVAVLASAFQESVVDVLAAKTLRAAGADRRPRDRRRRRGGEQRRAACPPGGRRGVARAWTS